MGPSPSPRRSRAARAGLGLTSLALAAVGLAAGVAGAAQAGTPSASPAAAADGWVATHTQALALAGTALGATDPAQVLHVTLALEPRHYAAMQQAVSAMYAPGRGLSHTFLTAAQWRARYAPSTSTVAAVTGYLRQQGLTGITVAANRLDVTAEATATVAQRAFHTSLTSFAETDGSVLYANATPAMVPAALGSAVTAVLGLNDVPLHTGAHRVTPAAATTPAAAGAPSTAGLFPGQFRNTYDANKTKSGSGTSVAVLSEGVTAPVISSLRYAEKKEKEAQVPISVVKAGVQSDDASGVGEFDMDTQASSMMATKVKHLYMYNVGSLSDSQVVYGLDRFVSDDLAQALSASIGGCEYSAYIDGSELALDVAMQEGALQGQSLFASSGDEGDACAMVANTGTPAGVPQDEWPAVGEFDTAVGGTSLISDDTGTRIQELAWLGGGGGDSEFELPGEWTQDTDPGFDTEFATGGRAVPDVALDADPNVSTPVKVYVGKTLSFIGGTSLSSPLMLGVWARLESAHRNAIGLASPALYEIYDKVNPGTDESSTAGVPLVVPDPNPSPVKGFTDITAGSNGLYQATPGWDYTTGLGAPDVAGLVQTISEHLQAAPRLRVTGRVVGQHGADHTLQIVLKFLDTNGVPATGHIAVQVVNGHACTASLRSSRATCDVVTTKAKRHVLEIRYSGDHHYGAVEVTRMLTTR